MTHPGRAWTIGAGHDGALGVWEGPDLDFGDRVDVIDEERVAFRVAQATLQLREENQRLALENAELRSRSV